MKLSSRVELLPEMLEYVVNRHNDDMQVTLRGASIDASDGEYSPVRLETSRGEVSCRYYAAKGVKLGALWVGGAGGGWDSPARGLYGHISESLAQSGVASLRVCY